jgi:hypothetical protein
MKPVARQRQIGRPERSIQVSEHIRNPVHLVSPDLTRIPLLKQAL